MNAQLTSRLARYNLSEKSVRFLSATFATALLGEILEISEWREARTALFRRVHVPPLRALTRANNAVALELLRRCDPSLPVENPPTLPTSQGCAHAAKVRASCTTTRRCL